MKEIGFQTWILLLTGSMSLIGCSSTPSEGGGILQVRYAVPPACQSGSGVQYAASHVKFSGVELPIGHTTTPVKVGAFEWGPDVINQASDRVQVMDQHRLYVCANLGYITDKATRDAAAAQAIEDENLNYRLALALTSGDPVQVKAAMDEQSKKADAITKDQKAVAEKPALVQKAEAVKQPLPAVPPYPNSTAAAPRPEPVASGDRTYKLAADMHAGDCTLYAGSFVTVAGTTATFQLITQTNHTFSGDIWHQFWQGRDKNGNVVLTIGPADSAGRMKQGDPKLTTSGTAVVNGASDVDKVVDVVWQGQC
jgi:hypothetical protein